MSDPSAKSDLQESFGWQIAWMLLQLAALGLAAGRVPLSARYTETGEQWAVNVMLVTQVGLAAMIFPRLLCGWRSTICAIAIAWVFVELAAFLADCPDINAARGAGFVMIWLITLAVWRSALPNPRAMLFAAAMATTLSLGGVGVSYLMHEFGGRELNIDWQREGILGPIMGALSVARPNASWIAEIPIAIILVLGVAAHMICKRCARGK